MAPAPLAGVWGLAPTLPNLLQLGSIVGSVATVSGRIRPLVISVLLRLQADVALVPVLTESVIGPGLGPGSMAISAMQGRSGIVRRRLRSVSDDFNTVLIAIFGGIGGALLTSLLQVFAGAWTQRRQEQHELDAWLRNERFSRFNDVMALLWGAGSVMKPKERAKLANEIADARVPLMSVLPLSLTEVVTESLALIVDELRGAHSPRSTKAIGWQAGYLQGCFTHEMGWTSEPHLSRKRYVLRRKVRAAGRSMRRLAMLD